MTISESIKKLTETLNEGSFKKAVIDLLNITEFLANADAGSTIDLDYKSQCAQLNRVLMRWSLVTSELIEAEKLSK